MSASQELVLLQRYFDYPARQVLHHAAGGIQAAPMGAAFKLMEKVSKSLARPEIENAEQKGNPDVLVDVREGQQKDILGAKRITSKSIVADPSGHFSDKDANYVLCCDTGMRSKVACMAMRNSGFSSVQYVALKHVYFRNGEIRSLKSGTDNNNSLLPMAAEQTMKM
eukprot:TRINITY_DN640_c0_g2_i3.p2 TRINITY_DN640_c0_g2~~TRINITY_DN640_c0_g2_i3.p2  ORF type:complete len:167 (-),score=21.95 TRINITY_DN640_c0_g2_i3:2320-2820(-)